jgi:putative transcriptional regulator
MFSENLKNFRRQKGLTQEELAERLHVVRQTISKWEKGLSVPDADLLIRVAEIFETSVDTLLGETVELPDDKNVVAQKLEQLNALLAERNRRSTLVWKTVSVILVSVIVFIVLVFLLSVAVRVQFSQSYNDGSSGYIEGSTQTKIELPVPAVQ